MDDWLKRVIEERNELKGRIDRLMNFIFTDIQDDEDEEEMLFDKFSEAFYNLDGDNRNALLDQLDIMKEYYSILCQRIGMNT